MTEKTPTRGACSSVPGGRKTPKNGAYPGTKTRDQPLFTSCVSNHTAGRREVIFGATATARPAAGRAPEVHLLIF